ncbi:MAG: FtsQ-type POTRA domain-containing protein [Clostridiales Family XIII bacterium]|jgi:cell division protein FtsQ|nr:FtsQ-type POTRA domain-containing protein [Clostridiales Family XIII bacterium]
MENNEKELYDALNPPRKKKKRRKKYYLLKTLGAVLLLIGAYYFLNSSFFDIQNIVVENNVYYTAGQIIDKSAAEIGDNIFHTSMRDVKKRLLADPYIMGVKIRRELPGTLVVHVTERQEEAFVASGGAYIIIDEDGLVLRKTDTEPVLTELSNLKVTRAEEGHPLEAEENAALTDTLFLMKKTKKYELYFKKIDISTIIIRAYVYDHLLCEGTPEHFSDNLDDLKKVLLDLRERNVERGTIKIGGEGYIAWQPVAE